MPRYGYNDITTLVTGGGTITFNSVSGLGAFYIDPGRSSGLGMPKVRAPIDNAGQTDGYILHDFFLEGKHILLAGTVVATSGTTSDRDSLCEDLEQALTSIIRTTGTLNCGGSVALTVKCDIAADFPQVGATTKGFVFGLVSASPASP
jgi:hypothetical protein